MNKNLFLIAISEPLRRSKRRKKAGRQKAKKADVGVRLSSIIVATL